MSNKKLIKQTRHANIFVNFDFNKFFFKKMRTVDCPILPSSPRPRPPLHLHKGNYSPKIRLNQQNIDKINWNNNDGFDTDEDNDNCSNQIDENLNKSVDEEETDNFTNIIEPQKPNEQRLIVPPKQIHHSIKNKINRWILITIFVIVPAVFYGYLNEYLNISLSLSLRNNPRKYCDINQLKNEFPQQNDILWKSIKCGIESTLNHDPTKPSVFLFVYTDENFVKNFTKRIIDMTQKCMETENIEPVILNKNEMNKNDIQKDYGVAIQKYRHKIAESGVLFVEDLNKISATSAQAFHVMCDSVTPLVSRLIVYMTMYIDPYYNHHQLHILELVEENLKSNWSELQPNVLDPLLARVTDQVLLLSSY